MAHYYFLVGPTAAGKSTTDRNLRLRLSGELHSGIYQKIPEQDVVFAGRVLFNNGKKVLRFSGGDATGYKRQYLLDAWKEASKVIFEQYRVSMSAVVEILRRGDDATFFHIDITRDLIKARLRKLNHPHADDCNYPYDRPVDLDFQERRDARLSDLGVQVIYLDGDVRDRCRFIESTMGLEPRYDYVLYDFRSSLEDIHKRFLTGGDPPRLVHE